MLECWQWNARGYSNLHATSRGSQTHSMKASNHLLHGKWKTSRSRQHIIHHFICVCMHLLYMPCNCAMLALKKTHALSSRLIIGKTRTEHSIQASWQPVMAESQNMRERESDCWALMRRIKHCSPLIDL